MKYAFTQSMSKTSLNIKVVGAALAGLTVALATSLFFATSASAHEVVNIVNEGKANCYGKVASLHAKEGKGLKASYANWAHVGVPGLAPDATFQEEVAAIKEFCRAE